jgi:Xaa-Pro aminopeptidase
MAESDSTTPRENRSTTPISEAFRDFIQTGWSAHTRDAPQPLPHLSHVVDRRQRLSASFPGMILIIPAGSTKVRSNDTDYPYRPHTAFTYLTGWGSPATPGSILCGTPGESGHQWQVFVLPPAPRTSDEFYANSAVGEFWTGPRPGLLDVETWLGITARDRAEWSLADLDPGITALIADAEGSLTRALRDQRGTENSTDDDRLAEVISEMRLVKDAYEIAELTEAVAATHRGFQDIIDALPEATGHPRGERIVEGAFHARARLEGHDVGYGTIAASGSHACILHWVTNDGPVTPGDLLLVDAGVERDSLYTADITRTLPVSGTFSETQRLVYDAVLEAADAAFQVVKPGAIFRDIHQAAMAVIAAKVSEWGFLPVELAEALTPEGQHHRRYMIHGTSHHLGLDVHDCAQARREMYLDGELHAGMVFTIEPGLYFQPDDETVPESWRGIGVRIEDNILVTDTGGLNLSAGIPRTAAEVEAWLRS